MDTITVPDEGTKTYRYTRLCSLFNEEIHLGCDLEAGHDGAHRASVFWAGIGEEEGLDDD